MKTTLDLDDQLLAEAKVRAAAAGTTLKHFVETALQAVLLPRPEEERRPHRLDLPTVRGDRPPAVEVMDRRALYDFLDENP